MSPTVSFLIPFNAEVGSERAALFGVVARRLGGYYPDAEMCLGTSTDEPFNRSQARNNAFGASTGDVLVINDADTFCTRDSLDTAIELVGSGEEDFVLPYEVYYNLNEEWTRVLLSEWDGLIELPEDIPETGYEHRLLTSESGVLVVARDAWLQAGGYDERFTGYGWEDNAFVRSLGIFTGRGLRIPGTAYHLHHTLAADPFQHPWKEHNRQLNADLERHTWRTAR